MFQRGSKFYSKISSGVHIFRKISSGGNQFWGVHFCCDSYVNLTYKKGVGELESGISLNHRWYWVERSNVVEELLIFTFQ